MRLLGSPPRFRQPPHAGRFPGCGGSGGAAGGGIPHSEPGHSGHERGRVLLHGCALLLAPLLSLPVRIRWELQHCQGTMAFVLLGTCTLPDRMPPLHAPSPVLLLCPPVAVCRRGRARRGLLPLWPGPAFLHPLYLAHSVSCGVCSCCKCVNSRIAYLPCHCQARTAAAAATQMHHQLNASTPAQALR